MNATSTLNLPVFYTCTTATPDGPPLEIAWGSFAYEEYGVMCGSHLIRPPAAWTSALARDAAALQPYRLTLSDLQEFGTPPHDLATQMNETLAERQLFSAVPEDDARIRQIFDAAEIAPKFALELAGAGDLIVGGGEHLNRPRDIEQLHRWVGQNFDDADRVWRETRGLWHFRQTRPR